jgi:hypothetical protein
MQDDQTGLERILEEGIASYSQGEPLSGMEERVVARIRIGNYKGRVTGLRAAFAVGLVVIAGGVWLFLIGPYKGPQPVNIVSEAKTKSVEQTPMIVEAPQPVIKLRSHAARVRVLPKQKVFPTPSPLTAEERRLLALFKQDPEGTALAFAGLRKRGSEPIEIAPLVIPPLEGGGGQ